MSTFTFTIEDLEREINKVAKRVVSYLAKNELISIKTNDDFQKIWQS